MDIPAAGAIVFDADRRILLVRRSRPPQIGHWTVPGGKSRPGENTRTTCVRELAEETGLVGEVQRHAGRVRRRAPGGVFVIDDYVCVVTGGVASAGDDAAELGWFSRADLDAIPLVDGLAATLGAWALLPC